MSFDPGKYQSPRASLTLTKPIVWGCGICLVVGIGLYSWLHMQDLDKAKHWAMTSKDSFRSGAYDSALADINHALAVDNSIEYLKIKLDILMNQNKPNEMLSVLEELHAKDSKNDYWPMLLGNFSYQESDTSKAITYYEKVVALSPENLEGRLALARCYAQIGKETEANAIYEALVKDDPDNFSIWSQYALAYGHLENHDKALAILNRSLAHHKDNFEAHFLLGQEYDVINKKDLAITHYRKSLELKPMKNTIAAKRIFELTGKRVPYSLENMVSNRIPFKRTQNLMIVEAVLNGHPGRFLLDTGASLVVVFAHNAKALGVTPSRLRSHISTGNGTAEAQLCRTDVQLGPYHLKNFQCAILPKPVALDVDGILGNNIFQEFRMEVDPSSQEIVLTH